MPRFNKIMVGLGHDERDPGLLQYASFLCGLLQPSHIYFVHVTQPVNLPDTLRQTFPDLFELVDENRQVDLEEMVRIHFNPSPMPEIRIDVLEGGVLTELLRCARERAVDLFIIGRKAPSTISGLLSEKLVRKAPCSVAVIPEGSCPEIKRIVVPVDFSEHSALALETAVEVALGVQLDRIDCPHSYFIPTGYGKTGKSYDEFAEIMLRHARNDFSEFIFGQNMKGVHAEPVLVLNTNAAQAIKETLGEANNQLLVMGTKGRNSTFAVLLGSVTEQLVWSTQCPMIAVKQKGSTLNFLESLLGVGC